MLRPARGAQIQVHVPGLQSQPVHGRQMPDRVAHVRMRDELRPCGGAGGEVQEQQILGSRRRLRHELPGGAARTIVGNPALYVPSHGDAQRRTRQSGEAPRQARIGHDRLHPAALEAIAQVFVLQQRRGRDHDRAEPDGREHGLPQRHAVRQHDQQPIPGAQTLGGEEARDLRRALRQLAECQGLIGARVVDDAQRGGAVAGGDHIEVVAHPVEFLERRPAELPLRARPVLPAAQQLIPHLDKPAAGGHDGALPRATPA